MATLEAHKIVSNEGAKAETLESWKFEIGWFEWANFEPILNSQLVVSNIRGPQLNIIVTLSPQWSSVRLYNTTSERLSSRLNIQCRGYGCELVAIYTLE